MRLPIGYWAFDVSAGEPFIQGQLPYLTKAVNWARAHGLKLVVDLHGKKLLRSSAISILSKAFRGPWKPEWVRITRLRSFTKDLSNFSFDNSGQRMSYPYVRRDTYAL